MHSFISKLRINFKSILSLLIILFFLLIAAIVNFFLNLSNENFTISNQNFFSKILLIAIFVISIVILFFIIVLRQKLIILGKEIALRQNKLNQDEKLVFEPISENSYPNEVKILISKFNEFVQNQNFLQKRNSILDENRERFELALQGSKIGLWDWNLTNNYCYFSPAWRNILGHTEESIHNLPTEWLTRVHPEDIDSLRNEINDHIAGKTQIFEKEHRIRHMDNTYIWVFARGLVRKDEGGAPNRFVGTIENISQRKSLEAKLMIEAMYDPLTGLPNRTYFSGVIEQSLGRIHRREDYHSSVLFIDLDRFKNIVDNYSYSIGEGLLIEFARRLKYCLRSMDTISRFSEDQFGVLLEEINGLPDTIKITQRLHAELSYPFNYSGVIIHPTTSIGIVKLSRGYQDANSVLRDAESAMFQAKSDGRGRIEVFDKEVYAFSLSKIRIEKELKNAIKNREISVWYQPVLNMENKQTVYANSLPIWQHSQKGFIPQDQYLAVAEDSGEIIPINTFILRRACLDASEWNLAENTNLKLSVPISPKLLMMTDFTEIVLSALADSNLQNGSLQLVISESSQIYNSGIAIQSMVNLSSIGVTFCLADYGVIPSSLEQLKRLPIHALIISETLTRDVPANEEDAIITASIISSANVLGLQVIATGVESKKQLDFLTENGIHLVSGDYLSQPMENSQFKKFLH